MGASQYRLAPRPRLTGRVGTGNFAFRKVQVRLCFMPDDEGDVGAEEGIKHEQVAGTLLPTGAMKKPASCEAQPVRRGAEK